MRRDIRQAGGIGLGHDGLRLPGWTRLLNEIAMCARVDQLPILGMVIPSLIGNPYIGYINPSYWVDDHPLLWYGNNGSLDPSTCVTYPSVILTWLAGKFPIFNKQYIFNPGPFSIASHVSLPEGMIYDICFYQQVFNLDIEVLNGQIWPKNHKKKHPPNKTWKCQVNTCNWKMPGIRYLWYLCFCWRCQSHDPVCRKKNQKSDLNICYKRWTLQSPNTQRVPSRNLT